MVLCPTMHSDSKLQTALVDFCSLCTRFNVVKVVKVDRQVVQAAHVKARAVLLNL